MTRIFAIAAMLAAACTLPACELINFETIQGNGNVTSVTRSISDASKISSHGFFDVYVVRGETPGIKIVAHYRLVIT